MSHGKAFIFKIYDKLTGKNKNVRDRYGLYIIDRAYIAAEVELCIGLVTTALIIIYTKNYWLALGTFVGFIILEYMILMAVSMAENIVCIRKQVDALTIAGQQGKAVEFDFEKAGYEEEDPYKLVRIIGISTAITVGIVLARTYL